MSQTARISRLINGAYDKPFPAVTVKAWRLTAVNEGIPIDLPATEGDIANQAVIHGCVQHKESIAILRTDMAMRPERRNLVMIYAVKRRSTPRYVKGPDGTTIRAHDEYADLVTQFYAADFAPVEPFVAGRGDAVGVDRTLVDYRGEGL